MKKIDFPLIADSLFYAVCAGFFSLCLLRYYRVPVIGAIALAILFAAAVGGLTFLFVFGKHRKRNLSKAEREERDALLLHLALERPERIRATLLSAYAADGKAAHCAGDTLCVDGTEYLAEFTLQPLSADRLAHMIREHGKDQFRLVCNALSPEAEKLASSFGIKADRGDDVYALFKKTDTMPAPLICGEIPRKTVKSKLHRSFSKTNARPFLVSGLVLLTMSLFTFFPVYYLVTGSILLLSAVTVRMFGYA